MKKLSVLAVMLAATLSAYSQNPQVSEVEERVTSLEETVKRMNQLKLSGYIQGQYKWNEAGVDDGTQNDFSVRRGRLKAAYTSKFGEAVLQLDITEGGVGIKDAYFKFADPRLNWGYLQAGVFDRPFGYEISYSSSRRESPERSIVFLTLFPKERDLGAMIGLRGPKNTALQNFSLNAGLFTGNGGQSKETDSKKDFIGHLAFAKNYGMFSFGLGTSLYAGGVRVWNEDQSVYKMENKTWVVDQSKTAGKYAKRQYYGFDGQFAVKSGIFTTTLRTEYLWGTQPGQAGSSSSPTGKVTANMCLRNFSGYYAYLIQEIGRHGVVLKYDAYDPNTKVSGNACLNDGDVKFDAFGLGYIYNANSNVRIMAYYEWKGNEKVNNETVSSKLARNVKDDTFTLRLQYKF